MIEIEQFPCRSDNFGVLIHDAAAGLTASIDAPEARPIIAALQRRGWKLTHIFTTHHHGDHVEGNLALKQHSGAEIIGPHAERDRIPGIDRTVGGGDRFQFGALDVEVIATPGHTAGHVSYHIPAASLAFTGDTLFSLGCGRLFEAGPEVMLASLRKLRALPAETRIYCGHEYTQQNARFALTVDPDNPVLRQRAREIEKLRGENRPTLPTTLAAEIAANPFLRWDDPAIRRNLGMGDASDEAVLAEIRKRKDRF